jgi:hypothetical protein
MYNYGTLGLLASTFLRCHVKLLFFSGAGRGNCQIKRTSNEANICFVLDILKQC